jgi:hypothetical protein
VGLFGEQAFRHPVATTTAGALGFALVGVVRYIWIAVARLRYLLCSPTALEDSTDSDTNSESSDKLGHQCYLQVEFRKFLTAFVPALCRMLNCVFLQIAELYLPLPVLQGLNSLSLLFTVALSASMLGERVGCSRWFSVIVCSMGVVLFCVSNSLGGSTGQPATPLHLQMLAYFLATLAALANSVATVAKAKLMKGTDIDAAQLAGFMGFWMVLSLPTLIYPMLAVMNNGDAEWWGSDLRSIHIQVQNNYMIRWLLVANIVGTAAATLCGNLVIAHLSGTWKMVLGGPATIAALWAVDLTTFYAGCSECAWASPWTSSSWLQVVGVLAIALGTLGYSYSPPPECELFIQGSEDEERPASRRDMSPEQEQEAGAGSRDF